MSAVFPINADTRFRITTATAGQTAFSVPFPFQDNADITVIKLDGTTGAETVLEEIEDYTLTGAGEDDGGTVTLTAGAVAGDKYIRVGQAVLERVLSVTRSGKFRSKAIDDDLDRFVIIAQELQRESDRSLKVDYGEATPKVQLGEAGSFLQYDEDGNIVAGFPTIDLAAVTVTSIAQLKALSPLVTGLAKLTDGKRGGDFVWREGDYSADVAVDTAGGVFLASSSIPDTVGAWVRVLDGAQGKLKASWFDVKGDGTTDDAGAIVVALAVAARIWRGLRFDAGAVHRLNSTVSFAGAVVEADAVGAKFAFFHTGTGFDFSAPYAETKDLSGDYTIGATTVAVSAMLVALNVGEPFKIVSDAVDGSDRDSGSGANQYRTGEWAVATDGTTATSITLEAPLRFAKGLSPASTTGDEAEVDAYTTSLNARVYRLAPDVPFNWTGGEFYYDNSIDVTGASGAKAAAIVISGRTRPRAARVLVSRSGGPGIQLAGNYLPVVDADVRNCTDDSSNGHFGYGVSDTSFGSRVKVSGGNCRHLYTSAVPQGAADTQISAVVLGMGRTVGARVSGYAYGSGAANVAPWDTHHSSDDVIFDSCHAENCGGAGFDVRGRNIKIVNPVIRNCATGINILTEFNSGDPDDDLWTALKSQGCFTSCQISNADIECVADPITTTQATVHVSGFMRARSAGHRLINNAGSEVHITGHVEHEVSTLLGARTIQEQTGVGWVTITDIVASASGAIPVAKVVFERGSSVDYDATNATDALDDIYLFNVAANCQLELNGQMDAILSNDFKLAADTGTLFSFGEGGWLTYAYVGAADNLLPSLNVTRTGLRVRAQDGTLRWDGAKHYDGDSEKLLYANNDVAASHTGNTSPNNNVYTPPQPQVAAIDEAGHYQRVEITGRKTNGGSPSTAVLTMRSNGSGNLSATMAANDTTFHLIFEMWTRGDDSQTFRLRAFFGPNTAAGTMVTSHVDRTYDLAAADHFARLGVTLANSGDTITVDTVRVYGDIGGFV